jgi:sugar lactone lactonase YvrE
VAAAVEPPIHHRLDPAAGRLEDRGHGQGGGRHHQGGVPLQELAQPELPSGVAVDASHLYWANLNEGTINRAKLDGSSPQAIVSGQSSPQFMTITRP